jgi:hypothetical protein
VNVTTELEQRLPENLQGLAAPLAGSLQVAAIRAADGLLSRPRVQAAWKEANRRAHKLFLAVIDNKTKRPPDAGQLVIMDSKQLKTAQTAVRVMKALSYFLAFLVLALYALAVYRARGARRSALMGVGFGVLTVGIVILAVRRFAGDWVVDALTKNPDLKSATKA